MTTFISLASSATMFPVETTKSIIPTPLTPELVKARLAYPDLVVLALNNDHKTTIDAIKRRHDIELPLSVPGPDGRAPKVALAPGDELFIVQASLPRLAHGEVHSDEVVEKAPISFLRWRVPVAVGLRAPHGIPQSIFDRVVDDAYAIALWQRGETQLKDAATLLGDFGGELGELSEDDLDRVDAYIEAGDTLRKVLCHYYVTRGRDSLLRASLALITGIIEEQFNEDFDLTLCLDAMLAKWGRRAAGLPKDLDAERALVAPLFQR
jgi:hypothetical protein